ncbi:MAG: hypothetical protein LBI84_06545 [Propionibacteriaceae bacterium]|nr:hypothetical protein [Propionibacteriaceae bacterium]
MSQFKLRSASAVVAGALLALVLPGCGGAPAADSNPYAQDFAAARGQTDVKEVLDALADDVVSDAEYSQIEQLTIECLADRGIKAESLGEGELRIEHPPSLTPDEVTAAHDLCAGPRLDLVSPLYWDVRANPQKEDWSAVTLRCFKRFQLVDEAMTVNQFKAVDLENPPWDELSGDAYGCLVDPNGYAGGQPDLQPGEGWGIRRVQ